MAAVRSLLVLACGLPLMIPPDATAAETPDEKLCRTVQDVLGADNRIRGESIEVSVRDGWITLQGTVSGISDRFHAERTAARVRGVRGISNQLRVQPPLRHDRDVARDIQVRFAQDAILRDLQIEVDVQNGNVTLGGELLGSTHLRRAGRIAAEVRGVRTVRSLPTSDSAPTRTDEQLTEDVRQALQRHALLAEAPVEVAVLQGIVTLGGTVRSHYQRDQAEELVRRLPGIRGVQNRLALMRAEDLREAALSGEEVASRLRDELNEDPRVRAEQIVVEAREGEILLAGQVESLYQKQLAERIARAGLGSHRLLNQLEVAAEPRSDDEIRGDLESALKSDSLLYDQPLKIEVDGGMIRLGGEVADFNSRLHAARLASRIRGVRQVENQIKVSAEAGLSDATITLLLKRRLLASESTADVAGQIEVDVREGVVTLRGPRLPPEQKTGVVRAAYFTDGVRAVNDRLP